MKNIKKLKSYGKTVAASALLVGATVTGAAGLAAAQNGGSSGSDYTLQDYPAPFVDDEGNVDTSIVVGTDGKQADVVSAVDIAGDLGNQAFSEEAVEGSSGAVDGVQEDEVQLRQDNVGPASVDASDYSGFVRTTMEDEDGDDVFVTESADFSGVDSDVNETDTELKMSKKDIKYHVSYSPYFSEEDTITVLGEEYELVDIVSDSEVDLGSTMEEDMTVGDSYDHGPYTVEITGQTSGDNPDIVVRVSEGEEVLDTKALSEGDSVTVGDDDQFEVSANTVIFYNDGTQDITLESTYTDTTLESGEELPMDSNYNVHTVDADASENQLRGFTFANDVRSVDDPEDADEVGHLEGGESFSGPNDYFSVTNQGLTNEATSSVEFANDYEVDYTTPKGVDQTVDMRNLHTTVNTSSTVDNTDQLALTTSSLAEGDYIAVSGSNSGDDTTTDKFTVEVTDVDSTNNNVTVEHGNWEKTINLDDRSGEAGTYSTGYGFDFVLVDDSTNTELDVDNVVDAVTTQYGAELSYTFNSGAGAGSGTNPTIALDEGVGDDLTLGNEVSSVVYEGSANDDYDDADADEVGEIEFTSSLGSSTPSDLEDLDGESTLSNFGSEVNLDSSTSVSVMYPNEQRYQMAAFGSTEGGSTDGAVSMTPTGFPAGTGAVDSDISNSERSQNMILVGGPEVNQLVSDLADEGATWNSTQYENNQGVGVLDLVNDAFDDGYSALVVAGWQAEDTSAAADYLVNYNADTDTALEDRSTAQVNTDTGELVE